jgi:hypothetical protein
MRLCKGTVEVFNSRILDQAVGVFHAWLPLDAAGAHLIMHPVIFCHVYSRDFSYHIKRLTVHETLCWSTGVQDPTWQLR